MKKTVWSLSAVLLITVLYFCFRGSEEKVEAPVPVYDSTYIKIGVIPASESLPFLVAEQTGISDSLGLKLHVELFDASMDADTAFQNGVIDGLMSDMVKLSVMEGRGDSVSAIMGGEIHLSLLTTRQSRITESKNLKEKIVAITRNSVVDMYADKLLESVKLESYEMNKPQINSLPIRYGMLCQNELDGAVLPDPWASMSKKQGCHQLSSSTKVTGMEKMFALVFRDSVISRRHADLKKLVLAYNQSVDYINRHRKTEARQLLGMLHIDEEYNDSVLGTWPFEHAIPASEGSLSTARAWSRGRKLLGQKTKSGLIDKSFLE